MKFKFWSKQPVFHVYKLNYWLFPPGIINTKLPEKTVYFNPSIKIKKYSDTTLHEQNLLYALIKNNFLPKREICYNPDKKGIFSYFKHHNSPSFISFNFNYTYIKNEGYLQKKLISCMTTRPLSVIIKDKNKDKKLDVGYVDFLCVHKQKRKKGVAPMQIYTHYKNVREKGKEMVFLFKREGQTQFIIPMVIYNAIGFNVKRFIKINKNIPNNIACLAINGQNFSIFTTLVDNIKKKFSCFIMPYLQNIKHQIEERLLHIIIIMHDNIPIGCFVFRNPQTKYDGKNSIEVMGSFVLDEYFDIFTPCFQNALVLCYKKKPFEILVVENISYNYHFLKMLREKSIYLWKSPMAYYFYNFAYRPFSAKDVFLIN